MLPLLAATSTDRGKPFSEKLAWKPVSLQRRVVWPVAFWKASQSLSLDTNLSAVFFEGELLCRSLRLIFFSHWCPHREWRRGFGSSFQSGARLFIVRQARNGAPFVPEVAVTFADNGLKFDSTFPRIRVEAGGCGGGYK